MAPHAGSFGTTVQLPSQRAALTRRVLSPREVTLRGWSDVFCHNSTVVQKNLSRRGSLPAMWGRVLQAGLGVAPGRMSGGCALPLAHPLAVPRIARRKPASLNSAGLARWDGRSALSPLPGASLLGGKHSRVGSLAGLNQATRRAEVARGQMACWSKSWLPQASLREFDQGFPSVFAGQNFRTPAKPISRKRSFFENRRASQVNFRSI